MKSIYIPINNFLEKEAKSLSYGEEQNEINKNGKAGWMVCWLVLEKKKIACN